MTTAKIELPPKLIPVFRGTARYRGSYGGRGSAKTRTFAKMTAVWAYRMAEEGRTGVILCGREFQNSLDDSSMEEVKEGINSEPWLADYFDIGERYIRTKNGRIKYVFSGLRHNLTSIKSKARILLAWLDEAEPVAESAYRVLIPTVREEGSELWITWNPETPKSPTDERFIQNPPDDAKIVQMNWQDNPWFPQVLEAERQRDQQRLDPQTYVHIWEGAYLENSEAQVLHGKVRVAEFEPGEDWDGPYHGIDFGFANDPTAANKVWVHDDCLWVEHEASKTQLELDDTAEYLKARIPGIDQYVSRADCARPESISYLKRSGLPRIQGVKKWSGSVEDGIDHLRSYREIVIHPRCEETIRESRLYRYKTDRLTGDILPKVEDAFNHNIDAIRYALEPLIRNRGTLDVGAMEFFDTTTRMDF